MGVELGGFVRERFKFMIVWKQSIGVRDFISTKVLKSSSEVGLLGGWVQQLANEHITWKIP
jgi:hypothetical protein